jgi:hypothetical protein
LTQDGLLRGTAATTTLLSAEIVGIFVDFELSNVAN